MVFEEINLMLNNPRYLFPPPLGGRIKVGVYIYSPHPIFLLPFLAHCARNTAPPQVGEGAKGGLNRAPR